MTTPRPRSRHPTPHQCRGDLRRAQLGHMSSKPRPLSRPDRYGPAAYPAVGPGSYDVGTTFDTASETRLAGTAAFVNSGRSRAITVDARNFVTTASNGLVGPGSYTAVEDWTQRRGRRPMISPGREPTFSHVATQSLRALRSPGRSPQSSPGRSPKSVSTLGGGSRFTFPADPDNCPPSRRRPSSTAAPARAQHPRSQQRPMTADAWFVCVHVSTYILWACIVTNPPWRELTGTGASVHGEPWPQICSL